jgi:hypothetical protein
MALIKKKKKISNRSKSNQLANMQGINMAVIT